MKITKMNGTSVRWWQRSLGYGGECHFDIVSCGDRVAICRCSSRVRLVWADALRRHGSTATAFTYLSIGAREHLSRALNSGSEYLTWDTACTGKRESRKWLHGRRENPVLSFRRVTGSRDSAVIENRLGEGNLIFQKFTKTKFGRSGDVFCPVVRDGQRRRA